MSTDTSTLSDLEKFFAGIIIWGVNLPVWTLECWVIAILWGWFAVPLGLPALTVPTVLGLTLIKSAVFFGSAKEQFSDDSVANSFIHVICSAIAALLALGMGAVIHAVAK